MSDDDKCYVNTDREIYRGPSRAEWGDADRYYADSIHVTEGGGIGFNCGGHVIVMPLRKWFEAAQCLSYAVQLEADARSVVRAYNSRKDATLYMAVEALCATLDKNPNPAGHSPPEALAATADADLGITNEASGAGRAGTYKGHRPECALLSMPTPGVPLPLECTCHETCHTDHPLRHWDRTCPACVHETNAERPEPHDCSWCKTEHEGYSIRDCDAAAKLRHQSGKKPMKEAQERIQRDMATTGTARVQDVFAILGDPSKSVTNVPDDAVRRVDAAFERACRDVLLDEINAAIGAINAGHHERAAEILREARPLCGHQVNHSVPSDADYAIQHGTYLADAATAFMESCNAFEEAREKHEAAEERVEAAAAYDVMFAAQESRGEAWSALRTAVYEFEKRRDRALRHAAGKKP